jgi:hypothetical protein
MIFSVGCGLLSFFKIRRNYHKYYRFSNTIAEKGNPQLGSLSVPLESMRLKLAVEVIKSTAV